MSATINNIAQKPFGISSRDWSIALKKAEMVKTKYFEGKPYDTELFINSKEFFELIKLPSGELMVSHLATLKFAKNSNILKWEKSLENKAKAYLALKKYNEAESILNTWQLIRPNNPNFLILKALLQYDLHKNQNAWKTLCKIINDNPQFDAAYFLRASLLQRVGKQNQALEDINIYLGFNPSHQTAVLLKASLLLNSGNLEMLERFCTMELIKNYNSKLELVYIKVLNKTKRVKLAIEVFKSRIERNLNSPQFYFETAQAAKMLNQEQAYWKYLFWAKENGYNKAIQLWNSLTQNNTLKAA
jgi:predicted Zn-dependent protease